MARKARPKSRKKATRRVSPLKKDTISRAFLGRELQRQIDRFGLSRARAGIIVKDAASQMSRLMTSHFEEFSADRLATMLVRLGSDITITLKHPAKVGRRGRVKTRVE
ncbi:MAG: XRE family transcriptional regulator [Gemmatimonadaceae bacterium]